MDKLVSRFAVMGAIGNILPQRYLISGMIYQLHIQVIYHTASSIPVLSDPVKWGIAPLVVVIFEIISIKSGEMKRYCMTFFAFIEKILLSDYHNRRKMKKNFFGRMVGLWVDREKKL